MTGTRKPFSFVSWNSPDFLFNSLIELNKKNVITFWSAIHHSPEPADDFAKKGEKEHYHVYCEPFDTIYYSEIVSQLSEVQPEGINRPAQIRKSAFDPWFVYGLHDPEYLLSIGQTRHYHYDTDDFINSDNDTFFEYVRSVNWSKYHKSNNKVRKLIEDTAREGGSWTDVLDSGIVPINQYVAYRQMFDSYFYKYHKNFFK